ncbi:hypothetical protein OEZ86_002329 [Tetradesmus obliquus]|nr:hypothetical protein OEZ86_002329 [Tetradesmus obliquus]
MVIDDRTHNIVVCCDGTWCGQETGTRSNIQILADAFASKGLASNVSTKDAKPVEYNPDTKTDVRYFNGVGLSGWEDLQKQRKDLPPLVSGLVGGVIDTLLYIKNCVLAGDLPDRCKEAYSFIAEKYNGEENSRVWLFGLSRGAYTVRAVAGMINNCGILDFNKLAEPADADAQAAAVHKVYEFYRRDKDKPNSPSSEAFRKQNSWPRGRLPPVVFMGVLDTVGAEGIPSIKPNAAPEDVINYFHDVKVSSEVQRVFHAVATHDRLGPFEPCPVRRDEKLAAAAAGRVGGYAGNYPGVDFTAQEVWYPGAHYDIGRQDFVLGNNPYFSRLNRELNPLSSNVLCSQELADYPLLGRALKAHQPPPAAASSSSSSSSSSCGAGVSSSLCIVDLANSIQPGILPEASEDAVWQKLVEGRSADDDSLLLRGVDLGLGLLRRMGVIDAESVRLGLVLDELARALNTSPDVLLRDRTIPLPPKDEFGAVEEAVLFRVPYDAGGDSSYRAGGRGHGWFESSAYDTYQNRLREALLKTPAGFGTWLAARASGLVQLSSKWLFEEVSNEHRPLYFGTLAKSGYLQVAEGADYLLLVNPHGVHEARGGGM